VLLVASTGRCATLALSQALSRFTAAEVEHEPAPRLLREAWLRHLGLPFETPLLVRRLGEIRQRAGTPYGQTLRVAPLLDAFADAIPSARFVLLFRDPDDYVRSAASRGVLRRGDEWDLYRVLPLDVDLADFSRAERIALHWDAVNRHLLDFAQRRPERVLPIVVGDLDADIQRIAAFAGWALRDRDGLSAFLSSRPNSGGVADYALGEAEAASVRDPVRARAAATWSAIQEVAGAPRSLTHHAS
jgi:hypothetical protein